MSIATRARQAIWGMTPDEQRAKNRSELRREMRQLDQNRRNIVLHEKKAVKHLQETSKKLEKMGANPAKDPAIRKLALGVVRARNQQKRLATSHAQMSSILNQFNNTKSLEVMENSMKQATGIMRATNTQIRLPEMMATTRNFEQEQMRAETYEEMVDDMMDPVEEVDGIETEDELGEVNKLLDNILKRGESKVASALDSEDISVPAQPTEEEEDKMDEQMLGRMEALRSS